MVGKNLKEQTFRVRIGPSPKFKPVDHSLTIVDLHGVPSIDSIFVDGVETALDVPQYSLGNVAGQLARQKAEGASAPQ